MRRNDIFKDSYSQLSPRQANELFGKLHIEFSGEEGMDAGGVSREWFLLLSKVLYTFRKYLTQTMPFFYHLLMEILFSLVLTPK